MAAAGMQYAAQNQAASDAAAYQNDQYKSVSAAALDSYRRSIGQLQLRDSQEFAAASQAGELNSRDASAAAGAEAARQGAAGITGNTADLLMRDFASIESTNEAGIRTGYRWQLAQIHEEMRGLQAQAQGRISAAAPQTIRRPSALALGVGLAGSAASGASSLYNLEMKSRYGPWYGGVV
jgi:hypothetical protein